MRSGCHECRSVSQSHLWTARKVPPFEEYEMAVTTQSTGSSSHLLLNVSNFEDESDRLEDFSHGTSELTIASDEDSLWTE